MKIKNNQLVGRMTPTYTPDFTDKKKEEKYSKPKIFFAGMHTTILDGVVTINSKTSENPKTRNSQIKKSKKKIKEITAYELQKYYDKKQANNHRPENKFNHLKGEKNEESSITPLELQIIYDNEKYNSLLKQFRRRLDHLQDARKHQPSTSISMREPMPEQPRMKRNTSKEGVTPCNHEPIRSFYRIPAQANTTKNIRNKGNENNGSGAKRVENIKNKTPYNKQAPASLFRQRADGKSVVAPISDQVAMRVEKFILSPRNTFKTTTNPQGGPYDYLLNKFGHEMIKPDATKTRYTNNCFFRALSGALKTLPGFYCFNAGTLREKVQERILNFIIREKANDNAQNNQHSLQLASYLAEDGKTLHADRDLSKPDTMTEVDDIYFASLATGQPIAVFNLDGECIVYFDGQNHQKVQTVIYDKKKVMIDNKKFDKYIKLVHGNMHFEAVRNKRD